MQVYLLQDGEKRGPFTIYEIAEEVRTGRADKSTQGWYQGCDDWAPLEELPAVSSIFVEPPPRPEAARAESMEERRARLAPERMRSSVRLWARLLDMMLIGWLISMGLLASGVMEAYDLIHEPRIELSLAPAAVVMLLEGFLIHFFGTTPGKWLLRIRVEPAWEEAGGRVPLGLSFRRAFTVWWRGIGFWLLPLNIFMMAISQAALLTDGVTPWDRDCRLRVTYGKVIRQRVFLIIGLFLMMLLIMNLFYGEQLARAWEKKP